MARTSAASGRSSPARGSVVGARVRAREGNAGCHLALGFDDLGQSELERSFPRQPGLVGNVKISRVVESSDDSCFSGTSQIG